MATVEGLTVSTRGLTEFEALVQAGPTALSALPGAVYICDHEGSLVCYNDEAVRAWGRIPSPIEDRFCGSHRLFLLDGTPMSRAACPMADAVRLGTDTRNAEVMVERPDGSRFIALVNIRALRDHRGKVQGAINCFQDITAHKRTHEELSRKSQELEDFFENGAIGLHIVSGDGIILRANKAELDLLGYTAEEYVGRHIADFHADGPVIGEILHRLTCGEQLERFPARLRAKDGSIKHVLVTSNCRFEQGRMVNTRCFTLDVTNLRQAQNALLESESRLAATYEAATVGIAEADEQGRLLRVNDALCKMLGRSREQILATRFADLTHESDRDEDALSYAKQVRGEVDSYVVRKRAVKPNGEIVHLDVHSSSVRGPNGAFRYGVRVAQDVTEAKRMEDRIRASEEYMRDLLEALPAAVYTTDAAGRVTFYNKAAVEISGRTPVEGQEWCVTWKLFTAEGLPLPHHECPMAVALKENRVVRGVEAIAERPDGSRVPFIPYPTPLHDADGKLIGAINMLVDITDRKQAENRQKVLIDELNHRVKNTLATVQSLASQTARHSEGIEDFVNRFQARLLAVAHAHDLLTKRHWEDAPLGSLAAEVLAPVAEAAQGRVSIGGASIDLSPRAALSMTMALSELATNATKYGALSSAVGTLSLDWRIASDVEHGATLNLVWRERGGPSVSAPSRRGFGMRLIQRCVETDLNGSLDLEFEPDGVFCRMVVPLSSCAAHG